MPELDIELKDGQTGFLPGETVNGVAMWLLERPAHRAAVRLIWFTRGHGTTDAGIIAELTFEAPAAEDRRSFSFDLPQGPYSFTGKLVSLVWAVELVVEPGRRAHRVEIIVSPTGNSVDLAPTPAA